MLRTNDALAAAWTEADDITSSVPKFSFEYFPPKTAKGVTTLYKKVYKMSKQNPLFVDLTWGAGGSTSDLTMDMSTNFKEMFGLEVNMHLTCTNITADSVKEALVTAKKNNITSICALRGDPPAGQEKWAATEDGFNCALDLVKFIKKEHGDHFSLAVAGYPEGHPNAITEVEDASSLTESEQARVIVTDDGKTMVCRDAAFQGEMAYLKQKVDAGANLIITQLFYDVDVFLSFVQNCRDIGITVPILPGIMPLGTYGGFKRMIGFCKTHVPEHMSARLAEVKDDEAKFKAYGVELITDMCKKIWASGTVRALHFYCLNQTETVFAILTNLGVTIDKLDSDEAKAALVEAYAAIEAKTATSP